MIFLLDIILLVNLLWAYKSFKNIACPPVLLGSGMLLASIVATSYYDAWKMREICFDTVFYLGGSTVIFTLSCMLLKKRNQTALFYGKKTSLYTIKYNLQLIQFFIIFLIVIGVLVCYLKIRSYGSVIGSNLNLQELLYSLRTEGNDQEEYELPLYIRLLARFFLNFSYIICWFFPFNLLFHKGNNKLNILCIVLLFIFVFDGLLEGAKGPALGRLASIITIYIFMFCCKKKNLLISYDMIKKIILGFVLFLIMFESLNEFIGRGIRDNIHDKSSLFAIYCGAQIKNFDIYIQGRDGNYDTRYWGGETLKAFYRETDKRFFRPPGAFQHVGTNSLGNVYTQVYAFHRDFGIIGVCIVTFLIACISMFVYNKLVNGLANPFNQNIYLYIYSFLTLPLFMSFFSPRFTESVLTLGFAKKIVYICVFKYIFDKLFKTQIRNE